ncbi:KaiC protein [Halogranum amylolyticum]|uniref:KaiC protein n=1 Tax=Halogranum amylolyticum TaxID=660520 RepID=A0A1H8PVR6_9EURY|nr:ATPase domain-containing protein [Halogranum amylolyticum]SEO45886.1 KaiC protein [Halogranum amylolyticum]
MTETISRLSSGIDGLDDVLNGGYLEGDAYLIRGEPGTGKTLLGLHFLRHLERRGEMRKAIGVLKKRTSDYERQLREFSITEHGIAVGESLSGLRDVLTGTPEEVVAQGRGAIENAHWGATDGE